MIVVLVHGSAVDVGRVIQCHGHKAPAKCMRRDKYTLQTCDLHLEWPTLP